jgi:hypothetical protein
VRSRVGALVLLYKVHVSVNIIPKLFLILTYHKSRACDITGHHFEYIVKSYYTSLVPYEQACVKGPSTLAFFASVFVSVFLSANVPLHLLGRNPRNHGRKTGQSAFSRQKRTHCRWTLRKTI